MSTSINTSSAPSKYIYAAKPLLNSGLDLPTIRLAGAVIADLHILCNREITWRPAEYLGRQIGKSERSVVCYTAILEAAGLFTVTEMGAVELRDHVLAKYHHLIPMNHLPREWNKVNLFELNRDCPLWGGAKLDKGDLDKIKAIKRSRRTGPTKPTETTIKPSVVPGRVQSADQAIQVTKGIDTPLVPPHVVPVDPHNNAEKTTKVTKGIDTPLVPPHVADNPELLPGKWESSNWDSLSVTAPVQTYSRSAESQSAGPGQNFDNLYQGRSADNPVSQSDYSPSTDRQGLPAEGPGQNFDNLETGRDEICPPPTCYTNGPTESQSAGPGQNFDNLSQGREWDGGTAPANELVTEALKTVPQYMSVTEPAVRFLDRFTAISDLPRPNLRGVTLLLEQLATTDLINRWSTVLEVLGRSTVPTGILGLEVRQTPRQTI